MTREYAYNFPTTADADQARSRSSRPRELAWQNLPYGGAREEEYLEEEPDAEEGEYGNYEGSRYYSETRGCEEERSSSRSENRCQNGHGYSNLYPDVARGDGNRGDGGGYSNSESWPKREGDLYRKEQPQNAYADNPGEDAYRIYSSYSDNNRRNCPSDSHTASSSRPRRRVKHVSSLEQPGQTHHGKTRSDVGHSVTLFLRTASLTVAFIAIGLVAVLWGKIPEAADKVKAALHLEEYISGVSVDHQASSDKGDLAADGHKTENAEGDIGNVIEETEEAAGSEDNGKPETLLARLDRPVGGARRTKGIAETDTENENDEDAAETERLIALLKQNEEGNAFAGEFSSVPSLDPVDEEALDRERLAAFAEEDGFAIPSASRNSELADSMEYQPGMALGQAGAEPQTAAVAPVAPKAASAFISETTPVPEDMWNEMKMLGIRNEKLQQWGSGGIYWRFSCEAAPVAAPGGYSKYFEAVDDNPEKVLRTVLEKVRTWQRTATAEH